MGLFASLVFNNGTPHTFVSKGQIPNSKAIVTEYIEPTASAASDSKFTVKHDVASKAVKRSLLQRRVMVAGSDGVLAPITWNTTATYSPKHAVADVVAEGKLQQAAVADATFHTNFVLQLS